MEIRLNNSKFMEIVMVCVECLVCGKVESVVPSRAKKYKTCSRKCFGEYQREESKKKERKPSCFCKICNKPLFHKPSRIKKSKNGITCSRECAGKLKSILYKGEGNHQYGLKGELNSSHIKGEIIRDGYKYTHTLDHPLRTANDRIRSHRLIAERELMVDEQSILIDGKKYLDPKLEVHHKDGDRLNNDISNLVILTKGEHMKIHRKNKTIIRDELGRITGVETNV